MNQKRYFLKQWGSIFFILLLLVLKCADLHAFAHDGKKAQQSCTICQLAHAHPNNDTYVPPQPVAFEAPIFTILPVTVEVIPHTTFVSEPLFGIFLNKAPPVA